MSTVNIDEIVAARVADAIRGERIYYERQLAQLAVSMHENLVLNKKHYEKRIVYLTDEIADCKKQLEQIPEKMAGIPAAVDKQRAEYEQKLIDYSTRVKPIIAKQVHFDLEAAEKKQAAREQAEWAANV